MLLILLLVQEALKHPAGLGLDKVTVFVTLYGQNPASTDKIFALYRSQVNPFKNIIVNPRLISGLLGLAKVLVVLTLSVWLASLRYRSACLAGFLSFLLAAEATLAAKAFAFIAAR